MSEPATGGVSLTPAQLRALWCIGDDPYYLTTIGGARQDEGAIGGPRISPATMRCLVEGGWVRTLVEGRRRRVVLTERGAAEAGRPRTSSDARPRRVWRGRKKGAAKTRGWT